VGESLEREADLALSLGVMTMPFLTSGGGGPVIRVHVQPGAIKNEVAGPYGDALRVRVASPPVSGRANKAVLELLAKELDVPRSTLEVISGTGARTKRVRVTGLESSELEKRLQAVMRPPAGP
jgi:uncharacterized protein (TIGR00251 family)